MFILSASEENLWLKMQSVSLSKHLAWTHLPWQLHYLSSEVSWTRIGKYFGFHYVFCFFSGAQLFAVIQWKK